MIKALFYKKALGKYIQSMAYQLKNKGGDINGHSNFLTRQIILKCRSASFGEQNFNFTVFTC